jgi:hypothetical protein
MVLPNTNIARSLTGGRGLQREILTSAFTTGSPPVLQRAVVVDVISDPHGLGEEYKQRLYGVVNNPELIDVLIPNSIIAQIVSNGSGRGTELMTCLFPLYPTHFQMPIAPGEQVFVIFEDIGITGPLRGFWVSRIPGYYTFEDVNYTHLDRRFDPTTNPNNYTTADIENRPTDISPEMFQNGANTPETRTINNINGQNAYDYIFNYASAGLYVTPEPVPRWKKRPQELILQGANNALIMLGEDRNGPIHGGLGNNNIDIGRNGPNGARYAGAVDIVVGRGRYMPLANVNPRDEADDNPPGFDSTSPLVIENTRGHLETNKNPFRSNLETLANANEGNPDPIYDAARLYIVQQSRVDENYKLVSYVDDGIIYPVGALNNQQPETNNLHGKSYVVGKADNIRIIGRREPNFGENANIRGTILLIREGNYNYNTITVDDITFQPEDAGDEEAPETTAPTEPEGDLAYIYFDPEGQIQIEGKKIYIGRALPQEQASNSEEVENPEPYLRYSVYKITIEALQSQIEALKEYILSLENSLIQAFSTAVATPYSPITAFQSRSTVNQISPGFTSTKLDNKITNFGDRIRNTYNEHVKSTKIFGE